MSQTHRICWNNTTMTEEASATTTHIVTRAGYRVPKQETKQHGAKVTRYTLHETEIVTIYECDGEATGIRLNSGGYQTVTTKTRINQIMSELGYPVRVYQERGKWYTHYTDSDGRTWDTAFVNNAVLVVAPR